MARKLALNDTSARGVTSATRASAVYEQLRSDIAHGVLEPGSKLKVDAMGKRYGIGASPMREALSRLSSEGVVVNWDELPTLTHNRVQLESLTLRESIENRDQAMEDELVLLVHRLSRTPRSLSTDHFEPNPAWETLHTEFHRALLSRCPSRWLKAFCENLADEAYRFRQVAAGKSFSSRNEHAEHMAIFEATIEGRTADAVQLLTNHYTKTTSVLESQVLEQAQDV
jgi:GntR family transcriptional regulator, carbon starvation induced regulator